eukprot:2941797-Amphidinium_carterae.1
MKAHQSDKDSDEGRVERADLQGNRMADVAANKGTNGQVPLEPSEEWKQWSTVCQAVRNFWRLVTPALVGPELRVRPSVSRKRLNCHALKNKPCEPLKRKKRAKLQPGFQGETS